MPEYRLSDPKNLNFIRAVDQHVKNTLMLTEMVCTCQPHVAKAIEEMRASLLRTEELVQMALKCGVIRNMDAIHALVKDNAVKIRRYIRATTN